MAFPYSGTTSSLSADEAMHARAVARSGAGVSAIQAEAASSSGLLAGSAVSWSAIFAGAAAAAALSLILLILGSGLGLSSVSPWASAGIGAAAFGVSTILWLGFTQVVASGMGGYLAGRLRTKYVAVHNDEVYFRDTAHGFLTWALASLVTASVLASAVGSIVGAGASVASNAAEANLVSARSVSGKSVSGGVSNTEFAGNGLGNAADAGTGATETVSYLMDSMLRRSANTPVAASAGADIAAQVSTAELTRVFMNGIRQGTLPADDAVYVAAAVAARTGLTPDEAEARVKTTYSRIQAKLREAELATRQTADATRKATAYGALWLFVSLLIGAFFASWGATFGGRHRDF